jgi:flagellar motor switch protein FliG
MPGFSDISNPSSYERLKQESAQIIRNKLDPLLTRYCGEACQIIRIEPEIQESLPEVEDLGFESTVEDDAKNSFYVERANVNIQIDGRVTSQNRELLEKILVNHLSALGFTTKFNWMQIRLPRIGQSDATLGQLKNSLEQKLTRTLQKVIDSYCPDECLISQVTIGGSLITPDQAENLSQTEVIKDGDSLSYMKLEQADIMVELDSSLSVGDRAKILNIMKANTRYASAVNIQFNITDFPESFTSKQKKRAENSEDPYGLEKLRRTLILFKDLAGTKEVITNSTSTQNSDSNSKLSEITANSLSSSENSKDSTSLTNDGNQSLIKGVPNWALIALAALIVLGILSTLMLKVSNANRDAKFMISSAGPSSMRGRSEDGEDSENSTGQKPQATDFRAEISVKMKIEDLKNELIDIFLKSPRVAKETFSRMLSEDGLEITGKYIHIFGHLIIFELLGDPNLSRDLFDLSEYYHKSNYDFTKQDEMILLVGLKTKVTANEIRVLARKAMDQFDFLLKLDPTQVYNLVIDERPTIQSIVLTQLEHKKRRLVFDLFDGSNKVGLMRELCQADAIPKEYLSNVAKAMHKKIQSKPEFDTENLRSADIILDLLEKSTLDDQRALMTNLNATNSDAARALKLKLVTVEILPYLKDGHLLEIVLGLDRDSLLAFLAGTQEHIRNLLLSKAPEELAESWLEDLAGLAGIDDARYRLVEMQMIGRIRNLANIGAINLLAFNEMIFAKTSTYQAGMSGGDEQVASSHLVA